MHIDRDSNDEDEYDSQEEKKKNQDCHLSRISLRSQEISHSFKIVSR